MGGIQNSRRTPVSMSKVLFIFFQVFLKVFLEVFVFNFLFSAVIHFPTVFLTVIHLCI